MKKFLALVFAIVMCATIFPMMIGCATGGLVYELNSDEESCVLIGFDEDYDIDKAPEEITIASKSGGKPVTKIGSRAFQNIENVKKIIIPEGVTDISASAFYGCINLEEIVFPSTLKNIGAMAFYNCKKLKNAVIPEGMNNIPSSLFYGCESLESVTIPSTVKEIKPGAFNGSGVKKLVLPSSVTILESGAFKNAIGLEEITFGGGIETLGAGLFDGCVNLKKVVLSDGLKAIYEYAFSGCSALESITIPSTVRAIYQYAFMGCTSLKYMKFDKAEGYECNSSACAATIAPASVEMGFTTHYHSSHWRSSENAGSAYGHYHNIFSHDISNPEEAWKMFVIADTSETAIGATLHNYPYGTLNAWTKDGDTFLYNESTAKIKHPETGKELTPTQTISNWKWHDSVGFYWYNGTKGEW